MAWTIHLFDGKREVAVDTVPSGAGSSAVREHLAGKLEAHGLSAGRAYDVASRMIRKVADGPTGATASYTPPSRSMTRRVELRYDVPTGSPVSAAHIRELPGAEGGYGS